MQIDSEHLAPASEGEIVAQLSHLLKSHGLIFQSAVLMHLVMMEQHAINLLPRAWLDYTASDVSLPISH